MSPSLLAILPLLLTLTLALFLRRTLVALGVGIVSGALLIAQFNPLQTGLYCLISVLNNFMPKARGRRGTLMCYWPCCCSVA